MSDYYEKNSDSYIIESVSQKTIEHMFNFYQLSLGVFKEYKNPKILDIGFGSARDMLYFQKLNFNITGIDTCYSFYQYADNLSLSVFHETIEEHYSGFDNIYDVIYSVGVIFHLDKEERISFLQNIFNKDIELGKELYLINYHNDFTFEKSNINKITLDNLSFNFFSLYEEDNEFLNNLIISSYETVICYILNIKKPEKIEEITELNYVSQAILQSFRKYREKNNLSYVVQFLKEYFDQERLSLLQPYIDKDSKLYNYFNGKFNVKLGESINIIKLDPKNKEHVLFEIAFLNSVLLFKRSQKNPSKFILSLEKIYDFNISKSYLSNIQRILRFSRKLNGSFYVPLDSGNYKYKGYLQDILCNINHLFLGQSKKNNENYFYLPKEYLDIQEKLIGSKEILYINNGIPYILSLEKEF